MSGLLVVLTSLVVLVDFGGLAGWFGCYAVSNVTYTEYGITEINEAMYGRKSNFMENYTTYNQTVSFRATLPTPESKTTTYSAASTVNTFEYNDKSNVAAGYNLTSFINHTIDPPTANENMVSVVEDESQTTEHNGTQNNASETDATVFTVDVPYNWKFSTEEMFSDSENILETTTESDSTTTVRKETVDVQKEETLRTPNVTEDNVTVNAENKTYDKTATDTINTTESFLISQTITENSEVNVPDSQTVCKLSRGWNLWGTDWGCCGNYDECCTYASLFCYIHDAICKCCDIRNNFCGPLCKPEPDCKGTIEFDGNTQREVEETNSDAYSDGSGEIEDILPPTG